MSISLSVLCPRLELELGMHTDWLQVWVEVSSRASVAFIVSIDWLAHGQAREFLVEVGAGLSDTTTGFARWCEKRREERKATTGQNKRQKEKWGDEVRVET